MRMSEQPSLVRIDVYNLHIWLGVNIIEIHISHMSTSITYHYESQGLSVTPETRTKFMMIKLRELVKNGIVKP